jgi:anti-anti-sigma factor
MASETNQDSVVCLAGSNGSPHLVLNGNVTIASASSLHRAVLQLMDCTEDVTICCENAEYVDTAALQLVLALGEVLRQEGYKLFLKGVRPSVAGFLAVSGLADALREPHLASGALEAA